MTVTRLHHINFVVCDLDAAIERFDRELGLAPFETVEHAPRGSRIARCRVGETWLVLVCPMDDDSVPGRYLAEHGEGFFLLSLGVDDLEASLDRVATAGEIRDGILDWQVADIGRWFGAELQLSRDSAQ